MTKPLASRGTYRFAGAVLAGCISATIFSVALDHVESVIFFIACVTAIPLFVVGLSAGSLSGVIASIAAFVDLMIREPSNYAFLYTFLYALPAVALVLLALRYRKSEDGAIYWYPEGHLLTLITLYPCVLFLIMCAIGAGHEGGLLALTHEFFAQSVAAMQKGMVASDPRKTILLSDFVARYLPAAIGAAWILATTISMAVAQHALQQHKWNRRSAFMLRDLHLPGWLINAVAITGLAGVLTNDPYGYVGVNLAIMLGMPFVFVGMAVVHAWAKARKGALFILLAFYAALIFLPFFSLIVALLGVADQWAHFRQRLTNQTKIT